MDRLNKLWSVFNSSHDSTALSPLDTMDLGPTKNTENPVMIQFFTWDCKHPKLSWWRFFEMTVPDLESLGFTQVWLPPPHKAMRKTGNGYDAYDLWDLGEFDQKGTVATRWGTKGELVHAVAVAKQRGMDVIIDAVLNHKLGADQREIFMATPVNPKNRMDEIGPSRTVEQGWTRFNFPGRGSKYSTLKWTHEHFTGVDWDHTTKKRGIYRMTNKSWSPRVDDEHVNYDYLLGADVDHNHPEVAKDLLSWGPWALQTTGANGFRLDAIKHIDRRFLQHFIQHARQATGRPQLFVVAEYWCPDIKRVMFWINEYRGLTSFFDVPLHDNFWHASRSGSKYDLRKILDNTIVSLRPGDAVTFVDNHEFLQQIGQSLQSWVSREFKLHAYALILLRDKGHPCVFFGDLYPNKECYDAGTAYGLRILLKTRKNVASGPVTDYWENASYIGWVRRGQGHKICAVIISNADPASSSEPHMIRMFVGKGHDHTTFRNVFTPHSPGIKVSKDGWGSFTCVRGGISVWTLASNIVACV
ncbi:glycoside hydrolase family 13 protein [Thelephora ganbajun]|uniref:Glycoside hydrolase family 13 protein n=1 Tax=Thelephora ganbajun TaxID=370292 RepID=A0ACB6ZGL4_THEGA|nr:glycoside hydrolase family 13 protein [Thelephora ganbajun]